MHKPRLSARCNAGDFQVNDFLSLYQSKPTQFSIIGHNLI